MSRGVPGTCRSSPVLRGAQFKAVPLAPVRVPPSGLGSGIRNAQLWFPTAPWARFHCSVQQSELPGDCLVAPPRCFEAVDASGKALRPHGTCRTGAPCRARPTAPTPQAQPHLLLEASSSGWGCLGGAEFLRLKPPATFRGQDDCSANGWSLRSHAINCSSSASICGWRH